MDIVLLQKIHHIKSDNNRDTDLKKLCCKIQVSLDVCCIHKIDDHIRFLFQKVITADNLLKCIRGK